MVGKEQLQTKADDSTIIFQERIKELKAKLPTKVVPVTQIPIDLADPRNDIKNLRIKIKQLEDRLSKAMEVGYEQVDYRSPNYIYAMIFKEKLLRFQLKTFLQEYVFLKDGDEALINLYNVDDPLEKNFIIEAFMIRALVPDDIKFPYNMVMGSVHLRAFMSMLQNK